MLLFTFVVLIVTYQAVDGKKNVIVPNAVLVIESKQPAEKPVAKNPEPEAASTTVQKTQAQNVVQQDPPVQNVVQQEIPAVREDVAAVDYFNLGISMFNEGMYQQAIEAFRQVLRMTPGYGDAHYNLAISQLALGNGDAAFEEYLNLRDIDPVLAERLYKDITDTAMSDLDNKYVMQIGAFNNNAYAEAMIQKLKSSYFHAYIERTDTYNKVKICGIKSKEQGKRMMLDIESEFNIKPYLVRLK